MDEVHKPGRKKFGFVSYEPGNMMSIKVKHIINLQQEISIPANGPHKESTSRKSSSWSCVLDLCPSDKVWTGCCIMRRSATRACLLSCNRFLKSANRLFSDNGSVTRGKEKVARRVMQVPLESVTQHLKERKVLIAVGALESYEHMGWLKISCSNGCICQEREFDSHKDYP